MIIFEVSGKFDAKSFSAYLKERNVFCIPISSSQVRMVTHLDITREMVNHLTALITTIQ
jgi:threonine aldolase